VQHHHAHIVSGMAEHQLEGAVIGVACDGAGYGRRHGVGGEVLVADAGSFERAAHLACVPMPGSAAAIKEPGAWPSATCRMLRRRSLGVGPAGAVRGRPRQVRLMLEMAAKRLNSPLTSSLGRLFDGVAAIAGLRSRVTYEGQAAMSWKCGGRKRRAPFTTTPGGRRSLPDPAGADHPRVVGDVGKGLGACDQREVPQHPDSHVQRPLRRDSQTARLEPRGAERWCVPDARLLTGLIPALSTRGFESTATGLCRQ